MKKGSRKVGDSRHFELSDTYSEVMGVNSRIVEIPVELIVGKET